MGKRKKELFLSDKNIGEDDIKSAATDALQRHPHLTKLDLSNNKIGCNGLKYLTDVLKNSRIKDLILRNNNLRIEGLKYLVKALNDTSITYLDLAENKIDFEDDVKPFAEALRYTKVTELDLSYNNIGCKGLKCLADVLHDTQIHTLYLKRNNLQIQGLKHFASVVNNTTIRKLDLAENRIALEDDLESFAEALKYTQITELDLSYNYIGHYSLKYLADVLKDTQISDLHLRNNNLENESVIYLAKVLKNTKIRYLNLTGNKIGFEAAEYLNGLISETPVNKLYLDVYYEEYSNRLVPQRSHCQLDDVCIALQDSGIGMAGSEYINNSFREKGIKEIKFNFSNCNADDVNILVQAFKNIKISNLVLLSTYFTESHVEHFIQIFEKSQIGQLNLHSKLKASNVQYLAEFLKRIKILDLDISSNNLDNGSIRILAPVLKDNDIMKLNLAKNNVTSKGVKYLSEILKDSKIVIINLNDCRIGAEGARFLAKGLLDSQVTNIHLRGNGIGGDGYQALTDVVNKTNISWVDLSWNDTDMGKNRKKLSCYLSRKATTIASKFVSAFERLLSFNSNSNEFEFIVPVEDSYSPVSFDDYAFLIETHKNNSNSKVHIIYKMCKKDNIYDFDKIKQIDEFLRNITNKFNSFFNNNLCDLRVKFADDDYVDLVKKFEELKLYEIVQNLLLHRVFYYVDESQEILHPYIYKLLNRYHLPLYNSVLEPNKRTEIILYYESHREIDGAPEIIDLLKSNSIK